MAETRKNTNSDNSSNNEEKVVNVTIPGINKKVPIQIGKIKAAEGCFLAKVVFEEWADARELERTLRGLPMYSKHKTRETEVSRVIPQMVANRRVPCYLFDCPFDEYDKGMSSERLFKAGQKRKNAAKRKIDEDHASLNELQEKGYDVGTDVNPTEGEAIGNVMSEEINIRLEIRKKGLVAINKFHEAGYSAKKTAEILHLNEWTVTDDIKRIKEVKKEYGTE